MKLKLKGKLEYVEGGKCGWYRIQDRNLLALLNDYLGKNVTVTVKNNE